MRGEAGLESLSLEELVGRSVVTTRWLFDSIEAWDAVIESGLEHGAAETWDRLAEHLTTMS
jgi:hypothetical protein